MSGCTRLFVAGAAGLIVASTASAQMVLNEFLYDPTPDDAKTPEVEGDANMDLVRDSEDDEFVELVNTGVADQALDDWSITVTDSNGMPVERHVFPAGTTVQAGCAIVVFGGGAPPTNNFSGAIVQTASTGGLVLRNAGATITLLDDTMTPVLAATYAGIDVDQSFNLNPELTGMFYDLHSVVPGAVGVFSPGTLVDGTAFGACEPPGPDMDGDGHPDDTDNCPTIFNPAQTDCNDNGVGDVCDVDPSDPDGNGGFSLDCNGNLIPDECEEDCNGNGIPDDCDIANMVSDDCNLNGIPDDCEADCNDNGVVDECDVDPADPDGNGNTSDDVNGNGVPDECELTGFVLNEIHADPAPDLAGDANGDGVRDFEEDEFVEIVNATGAPLDVSSWTVSDGATLRHVFPAGTVLADDCGVVVFGGGDPLGPAAFGNMIVQTASTGALGLNNTGDTVTIADDNGFQVLSVTYGGNAGNDASITLNPDVVGLAYEQHDLIPAANGARYSPGKMIDQSQFAGCPPAGADTDGDGIPDDDDNCPMNFNPDQENCDGDLLGDACETDPDDNGNGIPDNCEVGVPANLVINEIRTDQPSDDLDEYFELRGDPGTSLDGITYVVIGEGAGGSGVIEAVIDLDGLSIPGDGIFLAIEESFTLIPQAEADLVLPVNDINFENGDNVTHMLVANFSGAIDDDLDIDDDGVLDIGPSSPWTDVVDLIALIVEDNPPTFTEFHYGPPTVGPDGMFVPGHVYRCDPDDTWTIGLFLPTEGVDTPGQPNPSCGGGVTCDGDLNGSGEVDTVDLLILLGQWGSAGPEGDIDNSGEVDTVDLLIMLGAWGMCPK